MAGVRAVRFKTVNRMDATVKVEYEDGVTRAVFTYQLTNAVPFDTVAAKIQVLNRLREFGVDLQTIYSQQVIIE